MAKWLGCLWTGIACLMLSLLGCSSGGTGRGGLAKDIAENEKFIVEDILDGDSILVRSVTRPTIKLSIDLLGITADTAKDGKTEAEKYLRLTALNQEVYMQCNINEEPRPEGVTSDDYAYVFFVEDGLMINTELIRLKMAKIDEGKGAPIRYSEEYDKVNHK